MAITSPPSSQARQNKPAPTLYFAYGSNLHFQQMAKRCPESRYIGHAYLFEYQWQINQRGYANVVRSKGGVVEGLVFRLSKKDEERLDLNEGVSRSLYDKAHEKIQLFQAPRLIHNCQVTEIVREGGPEAFLRSGTEDQLRRDGSSELVTALVYLSTIHVTNGRPKEEYVGRMTLGLSDAGRLGMSPSYIGAIRHRLQANNINDNNNNNNNNNESNNNNRKKATLRRPPTRSKVPSPAENSKAAPKVLPNLPLPSGPSPACQRLPAEIQCSRGVHERASRPVRRKPVASDSSIPPIFIQLTATVVNNWPGSVDDSGRERENRR